MTETEDREGLAEAQLEKAVALVGGAPVEALALCERAEQLFRDAGNSLAAVGARLISGQALLGQGRWQEARRRLEECKILLDAHEDSPEAMAQAMLRLRLLQLSAESLYVGYQQGADHLEALYEVLRTLAEHLEKLRRLRPGAFETLWLFGRFDVYERLVAVAYQLGLATEAANWAERTKSRRLLDLLLNLPYDEDAP